METVITRRTGPERAEIASRSGAWLATLTDGAHTVTLAVIATLRLGELGLACETMGPSRPVSAGERIWLLWLPADPESEHHVPMIREALSRIRVAVLYKSFYGDEARTDFAFEDSAQPELNKHSKAVQG